MNIKKGEIIKYVVAILAALNLVWLFGFGYRVPGLAESPKTEEAAEAASTAAIRRRAERQTGLCRGPRRRGSRRASS